MTAKPSLREVIRGQLNNLADEIMTEFNHEQVSTEIEKATTQIISTLIKEVRERVPKKKLLNAYLDTSYDEFNTGEPDDWDLKTEYNRAISDVLSILNEMEQK